MRPGNNTGVVARQSSLMSSSSCELILKFELHGDDSPDGVQRADDVEVVPALRRLSLG